MSLKGIIRLAKCKNISEYSETELIMNFSLYQNALIDLNEMEAEATTNAIQPFTDYEFKTPKDIKTLKNIINSTDNIFLPCNKCERSMSFRSVQAINPMIVPKSMKEGYSKEVENALSYNKEVLKTYRDSGYITDGEKLAEKSRHA